MPFSSSASTSWSRGAYMCFIEGLPQDFTWQELKDLARQKARHGLYADMWSRSSPNGSGWVRTQRRSEAEDLYEFLKETTIGDRHLQVALWDISNPHEGPKCLNSNYTFSKPVPYQSPRHERSGSIDSDLTLLQRIQSPVIPHSLPPASPYQFQTGRPYGYAYHPNGHMAATNPLHIYNAVPSLEYSWGYNKFGQEPRPEHIHSRTTPAQSMPEYRTQTMFDAKSYTPPEARSIEDELSPKSATTSASNSNLTNLEVSGVFVSGIDPQASLEDVKRLFSLVGEVESCQLPKDSASGRSKGVAIISYGTIPEACNAIEMFHGRMWRGTKILVREDRDAIPVSKARGRRTLTDTSTNPLIVDGSMRIA